MEQLKAGTGLCGTERSQISETQLSDFDVFLPVVSGGVPNGRLSYGIPHQLAVNYDRGVYRDAGALLQPKNWYNWLAEESQILRHANYWPMIWRPTEDNLWDYLEIAIDYPQSRWLFCNEPEQSGQANVPPAVLAHLSAVWMFELPGNFWCAPNIVWNSSGKDYLNAYMRAGGMLGNALGVHLYFNDDVDAAVEEMIAWSRKYARGIPIVISETNAWTFEVDGQKRFMEKVHGALLKYDELQDVFWYSAKHYVNDNSHWQVADLFSPATGGMPDIPASRTSLGDLFASLN